MNAYELIEAIAQQAGVYLNVEHEDATALKEHEVRIAQQPTWPFEYHIGHVVGPDEIRDSLNEDAECPEHPDYLIGHAGCTAELEVEEPDKVIYIGEDGQIGYLNGAVAQALGWR